MPGKPASKRLFCCMPSLACSDACEMRSRGDCPARQVAGTQRIVYRELRAGAHRREYRRQYMTQPVIGTPWKKLDVPVSS